MLISLGLLATVPGSQSEGAPPGLGFASLDLSGEPVIGQTLTVMAVSQPAGATVLHQWLRNGEPIPDAAGASLMLTADDDLAALRCRVTLVRGAEEVTAETPAVIVRWPTPVAGSLADRSLAQGTGLQTIDCAAAFVGGALAFSTTAPRLALDPATGLGTVDTATTLAETPVTVTATNSGGSASVTFRLAVTAAPTAPTAFAADQWTLADGPSADGDRLTLNVLALPADGGSPITMLEYRAGTVPDEESWIPLPGTAPGPRSIIVTPLVPAHVQLRALNALGPGPASDEKTATPSVLTAVKLVPPSITGTARIGQTLTVAPGTWIGGDAYEYRWLRNGTVIAGATEATYLLAPAEDMAFVTAQVRARPTGGAWSAWAVTPAGVVPTYASPVATGSFANVSQTVSGTPVVIAAATTASRFIGQNLTYTLVAGGPNDTIEPVTGQITLSAAEIRTATEITIRATNSGGFADQSFSVTFSAAGGTVTSDYKSASIGGVTGTAWNTGPMLAGETCLVILRANSSTPFLSGDCSLGVSRYLSGDNDTHVQAVWTFKATRDYPSGVAFTTRSAFATIVNMGANDFVEIQTLTAGTSTTVDFPDLAGATANGKVVFFLSRRSGSTTISAATPALPAPAPTLPAAEGHYTNGTLAHMVIRTPASTGTADQILTFSGATRRSLISISFTSVASGATEQPPAAFSATMWTATGIQDASANKVAVAISTLPATGGAPILALQVRMNGGNWMTLEGTGTGSRTVTVPPSLVDGPVSLELHALNAVGAGPTSDTKIARPTFTPPVTGPLEDPVFTLNGDDGFDFSSAFTGGGMSFEAQGPAWIADNGDGTITADVTDARPSEAITFIARNSGGEVSLTHQVSVILAENTIPLFTSSRMRQTFPLFPAAVDETGVWVSYMIHVSSQTLNNGNVFNIVAPATTGRRITVGWNQLAYRGSSSGPLTATTSQPQPEPGNHRVIAWIRKRPGQDRLSLTWWRSDLEAPLSAEVAALPGLADLTEIQLGGVHGAWTLSNQDFTGRVYDIACGRGDPAAFFAAARSAVLDENGPGGLWVAAYNWAGDLNGATLTNNWRFAKYDPGAPLAPGAFSATDPVLADSVGTADTWAVAAAPIWSDTAPFGFPPFPKWGSMPMLTAVNRTVTLTPGVPVGSPMPTVTSQWLWNGTDVTAAVVGGSYTTSGNGQLVVRSTIANAYGQLDHLAVQEWHPAPAESGDANAYTWTASGVFHDGAYWGFAAPHSVGRLLAFDDAGNPTRTSAAALPFVVGTPSIIMSYPQSYQTAAGTWVNGGMHNIRVEDGTSSTPCQGFHGSSGSYAATRDACRILPLVMTDRTVFWKAISKPDATRAKDRMQQAVPLLCLAAVPKWDTFHCSWVNTGNNPAKKLWRWSEVDETKHVALPTSGVSVPTLAESAITRQERPILDYIANASRDWLLNSAAPRQYGRDLVSGWENLLGLMCSDVRTAPQKRRLLMPVLRYGIDVNIGRDEHFARTGRVPYRADGGHNIGRKLPVLLAGRFLNDVAMQTVMTRYPVRNATSQSFQEDVTTVFVDDEIVTVSQGVQGVDWKPQYLSKEADRYVTGMTGMHPMPEWRGTDKVMEMNASMSAHPYRSVANGVMDVTVLCLLAHGLRSLWAHEPSVLYQYRHNASRLNQPDPWRFRGGTASLYNTALGWGGGGSISGFGYAMLARHFPLEGPGGIAPWAT